MPADIALVLRAEVANAVAALVSVAAAQGRIVDVTKKASDGHREQGGLIQELTHHIGTMITVGAGVEAVVDIFESLGETIKKDIKLQNDLNQAMKGGATLGTNADNIAQYREDSKNLSNKFAVDVNTVVLPVRQQVGTIASQRSPAEQMEMTESALQVQKYTGQSASATAAVEENLKEAYPELSTKQSQNTAEWMRQNAGMSMEEQQETLPNILPSMSMAGIKLEDTEAAMATLTKVGGKNSTMTKGLATLLPKIAELKKPGAHGEAPILSGDHDLFGYIQQLGDLQKKNPEQFEAKLGARTAPAVAALIKNQAMFQGFQKDALAGRDVDFIGAEQKKMEADPSINATLQQQQQEQIQKNEDSSPPPAATKFMTNEAKRKTASDALAQQSLGGGMAGWVAKNAEFKVWDWVPIAGGSKVGLPGVMRNIDRTMGPFTKAGGQTPLEQQADFMAQQANNAPGQAHVDLGEKLGKLREEMTNFSPESIPQMDAKTQIESLMKSAGGQGDAVASKTLDQAQSIFDSATGKSQAAGSSSGGSSTSTGSSGNGATTQPAVLDKLNTTLDKLNATLDKHQQSVDNHAKNVAAGTQAANQTTAAANALIKASGAKETDEQSL